MGLETATYIADLVASNPTSSDLRSQGDDHLRLIKTVLQNSFPLANRPRPVESFATKSANYTVVSADDQTTFFLDTSGGAITLTLPTLSASDDGWKIQFYKYGANANPVFVAPPSGNLYSGQYSVALARRCVPGILVTVLWNGTAFIVSRAVSVPVGTMLDYDSATLPSGFEWPNGQTLSGTGGSVYPEYYAAKAALTTLDLRGRTTITLDNLGGSGAGRLAGGIITGTAVGNTGGSDTRTLLTTNLPAYTPTVSSAPISMGSITTGNTTGSDGSSKLAVSGTSGGQGVRNFSDFVSAAPSVSITMNAQGGSSTPFGILSPSIICSKILVVE